MYFQRQSSDKGMNAFGEQLLEFCNIFDCVILNGIMNYAFDNGFTYICESGSSVVDYYIASCDLFTSMKVSELVIKEVVESDHLPVELLFTIHAVDNRNTSNAKKATSFSKFVWDNSKESIFKEQLRNQTNSKKLQEAMQTVDFDVNVALRLFVSSLTSASQCMQQKCTSQDVFRNASSQWFDKECRDTKRTCNKCLKKYRKNTSDANRKLYLDKRKQYKTLLKQKKRNYGLETASKLAQNVSNSAKFWKDVKNLGGCRKSTVRNDINIDEWSKHFRNVFAQCNNVRKENRQRNDGIASEDNSSLNKTITEEEVTQAIKNLKCGKASGTDGILAEMLKASATNSTLFLVRLFNCIFESGIYPEEWSKGIIIPLYKKGNPNVTDNYRGISLISIVCKCYTSILNKRLYTWLEENGKIIENQAGFRKGYSTTDQIFNLYAIVQKCLSKKGRKLYVAFVDLKKAFDSVNHQLLLEAIQKEGVNGNFLNAIKSMYSSLMSCVRNGNDYSEFFECPVGVRQGCVLSPTLFSIFINELAKHVAISGVHGVQLLPTMLELFILLFADDIALISETPRGLQVQLDILKKCCDELKLTVNRTKTKVMVFRKGGFLGKQERWLYEGEEIEVVNRYCYLGFTFSTMLSPTIGVSHLVSKGRKAMYTIGRAFLNCKEMSQEVFFKLFDAKVQSILLYSAEIWGLQRLDSLETIHMIACKRFLGVPVRTPNKMVYGELKRFPLYINAIIRSVKYWIRLLNMEQSRLPKQAYSMLLSLDSNGKKCWITQVKELLCNTGFQYVWLNQSVPNANEFVSVLKQRLIDTFLQEWNASIRDRETYILYRQLNGDFGCTNCIFQIGIYSFRASFIQLRLGVLPINNNRYKYGTNTVDKMCPYCKDKLEDEIHFVQHCPLFAGLRNRFCNEAVTLPLQRLIDGKSVQIASSVAKFTFLAMKRRQRFIDAMLDVNR